MSEPLELVATLPEAEIPDRLPVLVEVRLRNRSSAGLWVNARLGVGYEDGFLRELYFQVLDENGTQLRCPEEARVDAHRMPPKAEDFRRLAPGESVSGTLDAAEWFPFSRPGRYRLLFVYENTWSGEEFGVKAFTGVVRADPVELALR